MVSHILCNAVPSLASHLCMLQANLVGTTSHYWILFFHLEHPCRSERQTQNLGADREWEDDSWNRWYWYRNSTGPSHMAQP